MTKHGFSLAAGLAVLLAASVAYAAPEGRGTQGKGWKKGQGWDLFAATFDANKDGKVTREEMLAKQPVFDRMDANHDREVTETEFDAMPAAQKNPNLKGWVARFDDNKDQKVSLDEWNQRRLKAFEAADKNKDGAIEKSEFTPELASGGGGNS